MADIILKDKNAVETDYKGIAQLRVPYTDDGGNVGKIKYTQLRYLKAYAVTQQSGGKYLVQKRFEYLPSNDFYTFAVYESECRAFDNGNGSSSDKGCAVSVFVTPKTLNVGEVYAAEDMY